MVEALNDIFLVIINFSVASVEAAFLNRPVVVINSLMKDKNSTDFRKSDQYLYIEDFFPERAKNITEITVRINKISNKYSYYLQQCKRYSDFHLGANSLKRKSVA